MCRPAFTENAYHKNNVLTCEEILTSNQIVNPVEGNRETTKGHPTMTPRQKQKINVKTCVV